MIKTFLRSTHLFVQLFVAENILRAQSVNVDIADSWLFADRRNEFVFDALPTAPDLQSVLAAERKDFNRLQGVIRDLKAKLESFGGEALGGAAHNEVKSVSIRRTSAPMQAGDSVIDEALFDDVKFDKSEMDFDLFDVPKSYGYELQMSASV